jgi:predicted dehydrogenase
MPHILLIDMAIHTFDAARFLTGADPISVYCREWNPRGSWFDRDASVLAIFEMSDGSVYTYRGSWCADGLPTTWESDWRIIGQRGSITWSGEDIKAQCVASEGGFFSTYADVEVPAPQPLEFNSWHSAAIHDFANCVKNGVTPQTICDDNIKSLAMVFSAIESAETGKTVQVVYEH